MYSVVFLSSICTTTCEVGIGKKNGPDIAANERTIFIVTSDFIETLPVYVLISWAMPSGRNSELQESIQNVEHVP